MFAWPGEIFGNRMRVDIWSYLDGFATKQRNLNELQIVFVLKVRKQIYLEGHIARAHLGPQFNLSIKGALTN